jgi:hypothetical protein
VRGTEDIRQEHVVCFQIPVQNILAMNEMDGVGQLRDEPQKLRLGEMAVVLFKHVEDTAEVASRRKVHDQHHVELIQPVFFFLLVRERVLEAHDAGVLDRPQKSGLIQHHIQFLHGSHSADLQSDANMVTRAGLGPVF